MDDFGFDLDAVYGGGYQADGLLDADGGTGAGYGTDYGTGYGTGYGTDYSAGFDAIGGDGDGSVYHYDDWDTGAGGADGLWGGSGADGVSMYNGVTGASYLDEGSTVDSAGYSGGWSDGGLAESYALDAPYEPSAAVPDYDVAAGAGFATGPDGSFEFGAGVDAGAFGTVAGAGDAGHPDTFQVEEWTDFTPLGEVTHVDVEPITDSMPTFCASEAVELPQFDPATSNPDAVTGDPATSMETWEYQGDTNRCGIYAQKFAIEQLTGRDVDADVLAGQAEAEGVFTEEGGITSTGMAALLDNYGVDSTMSYGNDISDIERCLSTGGLPLVSVDSGEIWFGETETLFHPFEKADHVVEVVGVDRTDPENPMVVLNDSGSQTGCGEEVPLGTFVDAWEDGGCQMVDCRVDADPTVSQNVYAAGAPERVSLLGKEYSGMSTADIEADIKKNAHTVESETKTATDYAGVNASYAKDGIDSKPYSDTTIKTHTDRAEAAARELEEDKRELNRRANEE